MDELVMNEDYTVTEFLEYLLETKNRLQRDVEGTLNEVTISTENCTTMDQLQNKLVTAMRENISERREAQTTAEMNEMDLMLDESIMPKANWEDPEDVLAWINDSSHDLNNPQFAKLIYKNGKTAAETMVDILKRNGYGQVSANQSDVEREISSKMSDLENYGFLVTDFFDGKMPMIEPSESIVEPPVRDSITETSTFIKPQFEIKDNRSQEIITPRYEVQGKKESRFFSNSEVGAASMDEIGKQFTIPSKSLEENMAAINWAIATRKPEDIERAELALTALPQEDEITRHYKQQLEDIKTELELSKQISTEENVDNSDIELKEFQEKYGPTATKEDMKLIKWAEKEIVKLTDRKKEISKELETIKLQKNSDLEVEVSPELQEFRNQYGSTATREEMDRVKEIEKKISELKSRKDIVLKEMEDIKKPLEEGKAISVESVTPINAENMAAMEQAIRVVQKTITGAVALPISIRNNKAMPYFNRAVETHTREDIMLALRATKKLGDNHPFTEILTTALNEMAKTYYGKSVSEIRSEMLSDNMVNTQSEETMQAAIKKVKQTATGAPISISNKVMPYFNRAVETHKKEDIILALNETKKLGENHPFSVMLTTALNEMAKTYYGTPANEIGNTTSRESDLVVDGENKEAMIKAIRKVQRTATGALSLPIEIRNNKAMPYFNRAVETHKKEDIILALNYAKELGENHPFSHDLTDALNQLSIAYYGADATELTDQFKNFSSALNKINEMVSVDAIDIPKDAKENEAMPYFYNAIQSKKKADVWDAIEEASMLPDNHIFKEPLLEALNAEMVVIGGNVKRSINEHERKEAKEKALGLLEECKQLNQEIEKYNNQLTQYAKEKKKEEADKNRESELIKESQRIDERIEKYRSNIEKYEAKKQQELEPPTKVIDDVVNKNPNLFKRAWEGAREALDKIKSCKVAKVALGLTAAGTVAYYTTFVAGAIPLLAIGGATLWYLKNKKKKEKKADKKTDSNNEADVVGDLDWADLDSMSRVDNNQDLEGIIDSVDLNQPNRNRGDVIRYYKMNQRGTKWEELLTSEEVVDSMVKGETVGYSVENEQLGIDSPTQEVSSRMLMKYIEENRKLPSVEDISLLENEMIEDNKRI